MISNRFAIAGTAAHKLLADSGWTVRGQRRCGRFALLTGPGTTGTVQHGDNK